LAFRHRRSIRARLKNLTEKQIVARAEITAREGWRWRPNAIRTGAVLIILIACSFLVSHGIAIADATDKKAGARKGSVEIKAHFETPPDHYDMMPPCATSTSVPSKGTCRGLARSTGPENVTGDMRGRIEYTYGFFIFPSANWYGGGVDHFTGTISGCGTGSVVYQEQFSSDSKGNFKGRWQMIEESGTAIWAGLRGSGSYSGITKPDGSTVGDYSGSVIAQVNHQATKYSGDFHSFHINLASRQRGVVLVSSTRHRKRCRQRIKFASV